MKTLTEQLASARREMALRTNCYPGFVRNHKMMQETADHELACQAAIVATIWRQVELEVIGDEIKRKIEAKL